MRNKILAALALVSVSVTSASAYDSRQLGKKTIDFQQNPIDFPDDYYSNHSMGCMLLQECKEGIVEVTSAKSFEDYYGVSFVLGQEFDELLDAVNKVGSKVYIAQSFGTSSSFLMMAIILFSIVPAIQSCAACHPS